MLVVELSRDEQTTYSQSLCLWVVYTLILCEIISASQTVWRESQCSQSSITCPHRVHNSINIQQYNMV